MPRIIIAGCGYVGNATAELFCAAGWEVEGWTAHEPAAPRSYVVITCDVTDASAVAARANLGADVVIQSVSTGGGDADDYRRIYFRGAENLARSLPDATLIFTSSTSVYAQRDGELVSEESPVQPQRETARVLRESEDLVLARGGIVARLAAIYGPERSFLLRNFLSGKVSAEARCVNQAHRDDIARALFLLAQRRSEIRGEVFNVCDDAPMMLPDCYAVIARILNRPLPTSIATSAGKRGDTNKRVSNAKLRALGWSPRFPNFEVGLLESVIPNWRFE